MVMIKANPESEAGVMPSDALLVAMGRYNEELARAGVMLDGGGLKPSSCGARVRWADGGAVSVLDGPFSETKELLAGYWILDCKSLEECVAWARRIPNPEGRAGEVEVRPFYELGDFDMSADARTVHDVVAATLADNKAS